MPDDFTKYASLMPDGATPLVGISIVKYLNEEGEGQINWHLDGDFSREQAAGILEVVKFDVLRSYLADLVRNSEDDD